LIYAAARPRRLAARLAGFRPRGWAARPVLPRLQLPLLQSEELCAISAGWGRTVPVAGRRATTLPDKPSPGWRLVPLGLVAVGVLLPALVRFTMCRITGADARTYIAPRVYTPGTPCLDISDVWFMAWNAIPFAILAMASGSVRDGRLRLLTWPALGVTVVTVALVLFVPPSAVPASVMNAGVILGLPFAITASRRDQAVWSTGFIGSVLGLTEYSIENTITLWRTVFQRLPGFSMVAVAAPFAVVSNALGTMAGWDAGVLAGLLTRRLRRLRSGRVPPPLVHNGP